MVSFEELHIEKNLVLLSSFVKVLRKLNGTFLPELVDLSENGSP